MRFHPPDEDEESESSSEYETDPEEEEDTDEQRVIYLYPGSKVPKTDSAYIGWNEHFLFFRGPWNASSTPRAR